MAPRVHPNGTSKRDLLDQYAAAYTAVNEAKRVLAENGPNARDYYVISATAFRVAVDDHADRLGRLEGIKEELIALCDAISEQKG